MAAKSKPGTSGQNDHSEAADTASGNGVHSEQMPEPAPSQNASPSSGTPGPAADAGGPAAPPSGKESATIVPRPAQFMIAPRQQGGVATFSADFVVQQLTNSPDIEVVKTLPAPRLFGFQSAELGQAPFSRRWRTASQQLSRCWARPARCRKPRSMCSAACGRRRVSPTPPVASR
jgi:hypothetical protein